MPGDRRPPATGMPRSGIPVAPRSNETTVLSGLTPRKTEATAPGLHRWNFSSRGIVVVRAAIKPGVLRSRPQRQPANGEDMRSTNRIHTYLAAWAIGLLANLAHAELAPSPEAARPL